MDRDLLTPDALHVAPRLLGALFSVDSAEGTVTLRITEVEAYMGLGSAGPYDPGSHSKDRRTERNSSMFLDPGHAYVYFSYGMHFAINFVCSPQGAASGVLVRAGEIVEGAEIARARRLARRVDSSSIFADTQLARGPGNVAQALGINRIDHDGKDLFAAPFQLEEPRKVPTRISVGPRVGVAGIAGGPEFPWRFWLPGEPTVSAFRRGKNAPQ
ncbi:3-methyladenine DNA glycosylase [Arthrobacter sp. MYb224]|nr:MULTISPECIES: DNA-3-methyladenine glycosylase [unclassified Arthrobacter]PQZ96765.1 3-methyladenine DNA glycosylase [Arthrobacter sp. MYb224]PRA06929.1 3-methyladenine DNA glycosylase [Arthrobacter sp. MYb229]PRB47877.1 3-methyladenine DNA glycosylase [Arthrobacter sp. MYb216]